MDSICQYISNIALIIFWKCLNEKSQMKFIEEQRLNRMNIKNMGAVVENAENYMSKYNKLKEELTKINMDIEQGMRITKIKKRLSVLERDY
ncbi:hypothetical protein ACOTVS_12000 [Aliarcobacter butzleri]|uniref:hypothetical protein n=1 Tax=Aliarcobacter butzleri TaxID=28197 RepID=UPI00344CCCD3